MNDSRITRIVDQLADLSEEEMANLVDAINTKRKERKKEKQEKAIQEFKVSFEELNKLDVDVLFFHNEEGEIILHPDDIFFQPW